ncbi:sigma 54-interacting transcriptional regulator [Rhodococcus sp. NPDC047139]|uniref:sigma 54-interacting transcriptional regulator n=1 Tax=Rhodococcus sp. NPDC047139 TaxID=3155141 RepID=UPI0033CEEDED
MSWIVNFSSHLRAQEIVRALCEAHKSLHAVDVPDIHDPVGLIVCSETTTALCETLTLAETENLHIVLIALDDRTLDPWWALEQGASDYSVWQGDPQPILARLDRLLEVEALLDSAAVSGVMLGRSPLLRAALRDLVIASRYGSSPILVLGETGTGKELAAQVVHSLSPDSSKGDLIVVDCTTIVPTLMGSELFGHERGAFTGAVGIRTGACAAANSGTLFLDEIGELPLALQPELMRVVQEGMYKRVGGDRWLRSRFRLICATNRNLAEEAHERRFRADLYYRIAATTVTLPPLRYRKEDIIPLFCHFYKSARESDEDPVLLDSTVEEALRARTYPGNVRELRQLASRVAARHVAPGPITPGDLPLEDRPAVPQCPAGLKTVASSAETEAGLHNDLAGMLRMATDLAVQHGMTLKEVKEQVGDLAVAAALRRSNGNIRAAAAMLGVTDRALHLRKAQKGI